MTDQKMSFNSIMCNSWFPRVVISLYIISIWDIVFLDCADDAVILQFIATNHYINDNPLKYMETRSNRFNVLPKTKGKSSTLGFLSLLIGVIAVSVMIAKCLRYIQGNDDKQGKKSIRHLSAVYDNSPCQPGGDAQSVAEGGAPNVAEGGAPNVAEDVSEPAAVFRKDLKELKDMAQPVLDEASKLCRALTIDKGYNYSVVGSMVLDGAADWLNDHIITAQRFLHRRLRRPSMNKRDAFELFNIRKPYLNELVGVKHTANPIALFVARDLLKLATNKIGIEEDMTHITSFLHRLDGATFVPHLPESYLAPLKEKLANAPAGTFENARAYVQASESLIPKLIHMNNILATFQAHANKVFNTITLPDEELLALSRDGKLYKLFLF